MCVYCCTYHKRYFVKHEKKPTYWYYLNIMNIAIKYIVNPVHNFYTRREREKKIFFKDIYKKITINEHHLLHCDYNIALDVKAIAIQYDKSFTSSISPLNDAAHSILQYSPYLVVMIMVLVSLYESYRGRLLFF